MLGEVIYEVVKVSIKPLLSPEMTASWEKGLSGVAEGNISSDEYMQKLSDFVSRYTNYVKKADSGAGYFKQRFAYVGQFYKTKQNTAKDDQK